MNDTMARLFALQQLQFAAEDAKSANRMAQLRRSIAPDVLAKYDRLAGRGRKPVAEVRNGVCCHCHIGVAIGTMFELTQENSTCVCDSCGRLLYLPKCEGAVEVSGSKASRG